MRLFNNDYREINGYSKDDILRVKNSITKLISDKTKSQELDDFLKNQFKLEVINSFADYFSNIKTFSEKYLVSHSKKEFFSLKQAITTELKLISNNLTNISSNGRNVKRVVKNNEYLDQILNESKELISYINNFLPRLEDNTEKVVHEYENEVTLWIEANKIKNLFFKFNDIPNNLNNWEELQELVVYVTSLVEAKLTKKIKSRREIVLNFHFDELYQFYLSKADENMDIYNDFIYMLYHYGIIEDYEGEAFVNVLERKESIQSLKDKMRPVIVVLIKDKLKNHIQEIEDLDKQYDLNGHGLGKLKLELLMEQKFSEFLPKIVDLYFKGLDKKFQGLMSDTSDPEEFIKVINSNYSKVDEFALKIDEIDAWVLNFDKILKPYTNITSTLKKTLANVISEILRRKEDYSNYLDNIKDESLRVDVRSFVDEKITEVNKLINSYEDETSLIIKEELPQLREIKDLLNNYKGKIEQIKNDVYNRLDTYKNNNIDMYTVIKNWEDNFNRKQQQLTFLLTVLMNKIFKSFKELIDTESIMFAEITEITKQSENFEGLPFNFALSSFLANKLSEDELKERISEISSKVNQITSSLGLYEVERAKLEEILTNKVKLRQGVSISNVQCTVCHKYINFVQDKLITCPFCNSTYHYLCVADWLWKHNSCPMCQNTFLDPNLGLFETE
ncbi:MAG: E3 ubiquitin protein ligase [Candidatus Lokiarchaeota archaeon]|nr:E3 ubiquitin protein ligase [Candidatus Lokiarchaeota archaeon]